MGLWYALNAPVTSEVERALDRILHGDISTPSPEGSCPAARGVQPHMRTQTLAARFDMVEKEDAYELVADAPGFSPSEISVELNDKMLTISGRQERQKQEQQQQQQQQQQQEHVEEQPQQPEGVRVWLRERPLRQFMRSLQLPKDAAAGDISASLDKGVLTVRVPKLPPPPQPQPRRIPVQAAAASA